MPANGIETLALLKELRELTANAAGAQRLAWTDTWLQARDGLSLSSKDCPWNIIMMPRETTG